MMTLVWLSLFMATVLAMEVVAYLTHRYLMHGPLWILHRSHHQPHAGRLEWNDVFAVGFALPSIVLIYLGGVRGFELLLPIGVGMAAYGVLYFGFHDVVVHRRIKLQRSPRTPYLRRIIMAHLTHHRTNQRDGAESFGFLYANAKYSTRPR